jgi:UDP-N-acetylglucosamine 4,6-dehydratase/5-epimerase
MDIKNFFEGKVIFLTGGTGSFGKAFIKYFIENDIHLKKLIIFSRDELKQHEMQLHQFSNTDYPFLRYFIGDVRDKERLETAMKGVDIVVHAAALKHVGVAEYNPTEFIKTNIIGTQNLLDVALKYSIESFVSLSTDKASSPVNLYGATKLCADKLVISSNNVKGESPSKFSVVRYGNVFGSRGSIVPLFTRLVEEGKPLQITNSDMTRFNISLDEAVKMVVWTLMEAKGGEIIVPEIPSYRVADMIEAFESQLPTEEIGTRPGEKIHEEMISAADSYTTVQFKNYFLILPQNNSNLKELYLSCGATNFPAGKVYDSGSNNKFLSVDELKEIISKQKES